MSLSPLNRMMQLAGLSTQNIENKHVEKDYILEDCKKIYEKLFDYNYNNEYKSNNVAATIASIGQILILLESEFEKLSKITSNKLGTELLEMNTIGKNFISIANNMISKKENL